MNPFAWIAEAARRAARAVADAAAERTPTVEESETPPVIMTGSTGDTPVSTAPQGPMLWVDLYWQDLAGRPNWPRLLSAKWGPDVNGLSWPYYGAILKVTQGTGYPADAIRWFGRGWRALARAERAKLGREHDFVRGWYHYLNFFQSGRRQAEYALRTVELAGGQEDGDALPIVDVEFGSSDQQKNTPRTQVADCLADFTATITRERGTDTILYGGSALAELKLRYGAGIPKECRWLWPAAYSRTMKSTEWSRLGYRGDQVIGWQYTDGKVSYAVTTKGTRLPRIVPGFGAVDCTVYLAGKTLPEFLDDMSGESSHLSRPIP